MKLRFWGTRGLISNAGQETIRYGGNTSCIEIRSEANDLLILDAGTGLHRLGMSLVKKRAPRTSSLLISHTHSDHIQGLPFFTPFQLQNFNWNVFGPAGYKNEFQKMMAAHKHDRHFSEDKKLETKINHRELGTESFQIGDIHVQTRYLNHPILTLGYRIELEGRVIVYCTDHEPYSSEMAFHGKLEKGSKDEQYAEFLADADIVIHDAQYTAEEYTGNKNGDHFH